MRCHSSIPDIPPFTAAKCNTIGCKNYGQNASKQMGNADIGYGEIPYQEVK
jgi:hypothetical protein